MYYRLLIVGILILPLVVGVIIAKSFFASDQKRLNLFLICFGVGLSIGICSVLFFLNYLAQLPIYVSLCAEVILFVFFTLELVLRYRKSNSPTIKYASSPRKHLSLICLSVLFWLAFVNTVVYYFARILQNPHGAGDAYHIWNLKARFLALGDTDSLNSFLSPLMDYSHPDYPLLVSGFIARGWKFFGENSPYISAYSHFIFFIVIIGSLYSALHHFKSKAQAQLAVLFLIGTPFFVKTSTEQFADVPLSFFFLVSVILLTLVVGEEEGIKKRKYLIGIGITSSLAMWTKNEGILFFVSIILGYFLVNRKKMNILNDILNIMLGALPIIILLIAFKGWMVPANDLIEAQGKNTWSRVSDLSRYFTVAKMYIVMSWNFGQWYFPPLVIAFCYLLVAGTTFKQYKSQIFCGTLPLSMLLGFYFLIYVNTYWDLKQHLIFSLDRLFLQLLPSLLFLFFMSVTTPEEKIDIFRVP